MKTFLMESKILLTWICSKVKMKYFITSMKTKNLNIICQMMKSKMMKITNMIMRLMNMKVIKMIKICMTQTGIFKMKKMRKMKIIFWMKDITGDHATTDVNITTNQMSIGKQKKPSGKLDVLIGRLRDQSG